MIAGGVAILLVVVVVIMSTGGNDGENGTAKKKGNGKQGKKIKQKQKQSQSGTLVQPNADGQIELLPSTATLNGDGIRVGDFDGESVIIDWSKQSTVSWKFESPLGFYRIRIQYAATAKQVDSDYEIEIDDGSKGQKKLPRIREATSGSIVNEYTIMPIHKAGRHTLTIRPKTLTGETLMTLKSVRLEKVRN